MFHLKPADTHIVPCSYLSAIFSEDWNSVFKASTMLACALGLITIVRLLSRGAMLSSSITPASRYVMRVVGGVPGVPTTLGTCWYSPSPSESILFAITDPAGLRARFA